MAVPSAGVANPSQTTGISTTVQISSTTTAPSSSTVTTDPGAIVSDVGTMPVRTDSSTATQTSSTSSAPVVAIVGVPNPSTAPTSTLQATTTIATFNPPVDPTQTPSVSFGSCTNPTIRYEFGLDGRQEFAYTTNNQRDFPFGSSQEIFSPGGLIYNRLVSPCNAPQDAIDRCFLAVAAAGNLQGQQAADVFNAVILGQANPITTFTSPNGNGNVTITKRDVKKGRTHRSKKFVY